MTKKVKYISIIFVMLIALTAVFIIIMNSKNTVVMSDKSVVYKYVTIEPDFAKWYDSYEDLIIDSDFIVFGTVKNVVSYMEDTRIFSKFDFLISSVEKGNLTANNIISVGTIGGKVLYKDYLSENREYFEAKLSSEYVDDEIKLHGEKYVETIFYGVPNVKEGEKLVLFLSPVDSNNNFYIVGSSYYGKFHYDKTKGEVYKTLIDVVSGQEIKSNSLKREMLIGVEELKEKISTTKSITKPKPIKNEQNEKLSNNVEKIKLKTPWRVVAQ